MNLIIVSGLSGSGKSIALHALEDLGYFCIDNLPFGMLRQLTGELQQGSSTDIERVAVSIDSRSRDFSKPFPLASNNSVTLELLYELSSSKPAQKNFCSGIARPEEDTP